MVDVFICVTAHLFRDLFIELLPLMGSLRVNTINTDTSQHNDANYEEIARMLSHAVGKYKRA